MLQNSPTGDVSRQKQWDGFLQHSPGWSLCLIVVVRFVSEKRSIDGHTNSGAISPGPSRAIQKQVLVRIERAFSPYEIPARH